MLFRNYRRLRCCHVARPSQSSEIEYGNHKDVSYQLALDDILERHILYVLYREKNVFNRTCFWVSNSGCFGLPLFFLATTAGLGKSGACFSSLTI